MINYNINTLDDLYLYLQDRTGNGFFSFLDQILKLEKSGIIPSVDALKLISSLFDSARSLSDLNNKMLTFTGNEISEGFLHHKFIEFNGCFEAIFPCSQLENKYVIAT
jgi:hypothetical protein